MAEKVKIHIPDGSIKDPYFATTDIRVAVKDIIKHRKVESLHNDSFYVTSPGHEYGFRVDIDFSQRSLFDKVKVNFLGSWNRSSDNFTLPKPVPFTEMDERDYDSYEQATRVLLSAMRSVEEIILGPLNPDSTTG